MNLQIWPSVGSLVARLPQAAKLIGILLGIVVMASASGNAQSAATGDKELPLPISRMQVKISSQGQSAVFRLYDTVAAKEFYDQLPLKLELSNFRDAQWMFYPPEKLHVTSDQAYHDGKKGELSYYAPWGDAFMLYEDFYAGDEMHRLGIGLSGIDEIAAMHGTALIEKDQPQQSSENTAMYIQVSANGATTIFKLNDSQASRELYAQLPMNIEVEDYGGKEKIFYPPNKLGTADTPRAEAKAGTLAYYAPWGDVVMFYKRFGSASGLYELGEAVGGENNISKLSGKLSVEKSDEP